MNDLEYSLRPQRHKNREMHDIPLPYPAAKLGDWRVVLHYGGQLLEHDILMRVTTQNMLTASNLFVFFYSCSRYVLRGAVVSLLSTTVVFSNPTERSLVAKKRRYPLPEDDTGHRSLRPNDRASSFFTNDHFFIIFVRSISKTSHCK